MPTWRESPALSSANDAIASKPRNDSTAIEIAPTMAGSAKSPVPTNGELQGRARAIVGQVDHGEHDEQQQDGDLGDQHDQPCSRRHRDAGEVEQRWWRRARRP